jgi:outer membrane cobalamin receptor
MASVSWRPTPTTTLQLDGYWKHHENLRRHRSAVLRQENSTVLFQPWTVRNTARARGLEALVRQEVGPVSWTGAYTLARVTVDPAGPGGSRPADWDRRHQVTTRLEWAASGRTAVYATWSLATGSPNPYAALPGEAARLDAYHRLDLGATLGATTGPVRWTVRGSLFNAYDRDNPWHRTPMGLLRRDGPDPNRRPDLDFALVDVYDLGVQPALSVSATW